MVYRPICPKCGNDHFSTRQLLVAVSGNLKVYVVYCSECGAVVGAFSDK